MMADDDERTRGCLVRVPWVTERCGVFEAFSHAEKHGLEDHEVLGRVSRARLRADSSIKSARHFEGMLGEAARAAEHSFAVGGQEDEAPSAILDVHDAHDEPEVLERGDHSTDGRGAYAEGSF